MRVSKTLAKACGFDSRQEHMKDSDIDLYPLKCPKCKHFSCFFTEEGLVLCRDCMETEHESEDSGEKT
jgi:hypothetical protein